MNYLKKRAYVLLLLLVGITVSCDDNDDEINTITGLDFTIATLSSEGNKVGVVPTTAFGNGNIVYSVDFGATADSDIDVLQTSAPLVSFDYPEEIATYTITVTASLEGVTDVSVSKEHTVVYVAPGLVVEPVSFFDDFEGGGNATWVGDAILIDTALANPFSGGINTSATVLEYNDDGSGQYANLSLSSDTNLDMTSNSKFTLKLYVPSSSITGAQPNQISLKLQDGSVSEPWSTQTEVIKSIVLDQWQEITFDFENDTTIGAAEPLVRTDFNKIVLQLNSEDNFDAVIAYIDDFSYGTPPLAPFLASDDFEGADGITSWYGDNVVLNTALANPVSGGINTSSTVLEYNDDGSGQYANARFDVTTNFDLSDRTKFTLKIFVPSSSITGAEPNQISLKLQDGTASEPWVLQTEIVKSIVLDQWQEFTFDFVADASRTDLNRVVLQVNSENNFEAVIAYIDDISYHN